MKKLLQSIFIPLLLLIAAPSWAQNKTVTGKVTDETGSPVPGASVIAKVSKTAVAADNNGHFSISVTPDEKVLAISAVGYTTFQAAGGSAPLSIQLALSNKELGEVVVVGYGTQKVTKISGAISTVKGTDIANLRPVRAEEALQGRASGVTMIQSGSRCQTNSTHQGRSLL